MYLCVFDGDEELEGVEVGSYADYGRLRDLVSRDLEGGVVGSRFPTFMLHSDSDGEYSPADAATLLAELRTIAKELSIRAAVALPAGWQSSTARVFGLKPASLADCFFDIDGEPLFERLIGLCECAIEHQRPILFQ